MGGEIEEYGLTTDKIRDRAEFLDDPERPDWIVFEVERHRNFPPDVWIPGKRMDFLITYWPRYAYNPVSKTFECLGVLRNSEISEEYAFEMYAEYNCDISFSLTLLENDKYKCEESNAGEQTIVKNENELLNFAIGIIKGWDIEAALTEYSECFGNEDFIDFLDNIRKAYENKARTEALYVWKRRNEEN